MQTPPRPPALSKNPTMPKLTGIRGRSPAGAALTAWSLWMRIPPSERKRLLEQARKHGPRLAMYVYAKGRDGAVRRVRIPR
jgi:hypothetical protein